MAAANHASYNGDLAAAVNLWFEDHSKSLLVAVMPHAQDVNEGMGRCTTRAEVTHNASDGTLLSDKSGFLFNELTVKDM